MITKTPKGLRGFLIDSPEHGALRGIRDGALLIEDGAIAAVGPFDEVRRTPGAEHVRWLHSPEAVIIPGLIDVHAHLPQYPVVARVESALLPWLERHAFPIEREFNAGTARELAPHFFEACARNGTTCAMLYAAIYEESCDAAFQAAESSGMRVVMGKVMMDEGSYDKTPKDDVTALSLEQSERLCRKWHGHDGGRLEYAFTPRFAVTCSARLMTEASKLSEKYGAYLQTHLAENREEIDVVRQRFPEQASYTDVYGACGLLTERSVFAHCIHLEDGEIARLAESRAVVAHCPTSNLFLGSGIMPLDQLQDAGLRIGLGSDVAGGPELNLWQVMRSTIESQKARSFYNPGVRVPTTAETFRLATMGGAEALGKGDILGSFEIGKEADVVVLDVSLACPRGSRGNVHCDLSAEEIIALMIYRGGPEAVIETFVRGRSVFRAPSPLLL